MNKLQWDAAFYDQNHAYVYQYGNDLVSLLALGCGTGHLTNTIAESGAVAIGIDNSPEMIEVARNSYPHLLFQLAEAQDFAFPTPFDAIFSNATLHWVREAEKAVQCMAGALKPGGRLVTEFGGKGNVGTIVNGIQQSVKEVAGIEVDSIWYYPSIGEYCSLLEQHGFEVRSALLFDRPTQLEGDHGVKNWIKMFGGTMLNDVPAELHERVLDRVEEITRDSLLQQGCWFADYRRLRIIAIRLELTAPLE